MGTGHRAELLGTVVTDLRCWISARNFSCPVLCINNMCVCVSVCVCVCGRRYACPSHHPSHRVTVSCRRSRHSHRLLCEVNCGKRHWLIDWFTSWRCFFNVKNSKTVQNSAILTTARRPVGRRMWFIKRCHFQWPWIGLTSNRDCFKGTPLCDKEYLSNGTIQGHWYWILTGTYTRASQRCHFEWPWKVSKVSYIYRAHYVRHP